MIRSKEPQAAYATVDNSILMSMNLDSPSIIEQNLPQWVNSPKNTCTSKMKDSYAVAYWVIHSWLSLLSKLDNSEALVA